MASLLGICEYQYNKVRNKKEIIKGMRGKKGYCFDEGEGVWYDETVKKISLQSETIRMTSLMKAAP